MARQTHRAQAAAETIILVVGFLILLLSFAQYYAFHDSITHEQARDASARKIAGDVADVANRVYLSVNGTSANFTLPSSLVGGTAYDASFSDRLVRVIYQATPSNRVAGAALLTLNVSAPVLLSPGTTYNVTLANQQLQISPA